MINTNVVARRNSLAENNTKPLALFGKKDGIVAGFNFISVLQEGKLANIEGELDDETVISHAVALVILNNGALTEVAGHHPWFNRLLEGMLDESFALSFSAVNTSMLTLTHDEAHIIGRKLVKALKGKKTATGGVDQWRLEHPAMMEMSERYPFFIPMCVNIGTQQIIGSVGGRNKRVIIGALLSILDFITDINATIIFFNEDNYGFAYANLTFILVSVALQLVLVYAQNSQRGGKAIAYEMIIVASMLKPAFDAGRVSSGNVQLENTVFDPLKELSLSKCCELVAEALPGGCLQTFALINNPGSSTGAYVSVAISCATIAYTSANMSMDFDTDVTMRMISPGIYGYAPDTRRSEFMAVMVMMTFSHVAMKFLACGLIMNISFSGFLLYLLGDMSFYLSYKTVRGDLRY